MFDVNGGVFLSHAIFVDGKIVAPYVWNEISLRILHEEFKGHHACRRIEMDLSFLLSLLAFKDLSLGTIRYSDWSSCGDMRVRLLGPSILTAVVLSLR